MSTQTHIHVTPQNNTVVVVDSDNVEVSVVNPVTTVLEVVSLGPQGAIGPSGSFPDTGSFVLTSSFNLFTSSYNTGSFTGSFEGTSSYANNSLSSSYAITASYLLNLPEIDTGSLVTTSSFNLFTSSYNTGSFKGNLEGTSSYSNNSLSSSYAVTASYLENLPEFNTGSLVTTSSFNELTSSFNSFTSSYNTGSFSGSFEGTSSYSNNALSSSYSLTASYALNTTPVDTGSLVTTSSFNSFTSSYNNFTSSYNTGSFTGSFRGVLTGSLQGTSSYSNQSLSSSYSVTSSFTVGGELQSNKSNDIYMGGASPSSTKYTTEYAVNYFVSQSIVAAQAGIPLVEIDMFANYKLFEYDENGSISYQGQTKYNNNAWLITKYVESSGDITATYANVSNNGSYTTPSTAWAARASLSYTASIANLTGI